MPLNTSENPVGFPFIELQSVDSTNKYAMNMAYEGLAHHGTAVFAHEQYEGKGQRGRSWVSEAGKNVAISLIISPSALTMNDQFKLSVAIALAVHDLLSKYAGEETSIKWPNDLYWRDRKAGGILIENIIKNNTDKRNKWAWSIAGIGLNINQHSFPPGIANAVSLKQITGKEHNPVLLAKELCEKADSRFNQLLNTPFDELLLLYNERLFKKGEKVRLKKGARSFEAIIKNVNSYGELIVETTLEEHFNFGDIEWLL